MSQSPGPEFDPESVRPMGDVSRFTRRRASPRRIALAALLAVVITAIAFGVLALIVWGIAEALR